MSEIPDRARQVPWPLWFWQRRGRVLLLAAGGAALLALLWSAAQPPVYQAISAFRWRYIPPTAAMGNVFFPGSDPDTSARRIREAQAGYCAFVLDHAASSAALPDPAGSPYGLSCLFVGANRLLLVTWGPDAERTARYNTLTGAQIRQRTNTTLSNVYWVTLAARIGVTALPRPLENALLLGIGGSVLAASLLLGGRLLAWPAMRRF